MLDIGWAELLIIGVVALIVVGPKELPALFRTVGQFTGRARAMAREFHRSLENAADQTGVADVAKSVKSATRFDVDTDPAPTQQNKPAARTNDGRKAAEPAPTPTSAEVEPTPGASAGNS